MAKIFWKLRVEFARWEISSCMWGVGRNVSFEEEVEVEGFPGQGGRGASGNRDNGDEVLPPPRTRSQVSVPVMTRRAINMIPAGLLTGAHVLRRFLRREVAQDGIIA
jgi:hypothetical protein